MREPIGLQDVVNASNLIPRWTLRKRQGKVGEMAGARRKRLIRVFGLIAALVLIPLIIAWWISGTLVAAANCAIGVAPAELAARSLKLESDSGSKIAVWHSRHKRSRGVIVLVHGIRSNRLAMVPRSKALLEREFSVVMIDLQAHGESEGQNITIGHLEKHDVAAAVRFARSEHPGEPIGVVGVSLGGASALLARSLDLDVMVVESVFPTLRQAVHNRVQQKLGPVAAVATPMLLLQIRPRLGFDANGVRPIDEIGDVDCPILVASGSADPHTPESETRALFDAAKHPKKLWIVEGVAHRDLYRFAPREYADIVFGFLEAEMPRTKEPTQDAPASSGT